MKGLPQMLLFPIVLIISHIPPYTFADFTGFTNISTRIATIFCNIRASVASPLALLAAASV
jgi:hypothetical protein